MHHLLEKILKKRGIKNISELKDEEKEDFDRWERVLDGGEMTVEKIKKFCEQQLTLIENQWKDMTNNPTKNERLIVAHTIYKTIIQAIDSPEIERSTLEDYLNQLITKQ